jgi:hypothetical protein
LELRRFAKRLRIAPGSNPSVAGLTSIIKKYLRNLHQRIAARKTAPTTGTTETTETTGGRCDGCNKEFKSKSGLWKHKKVCVQPGVPQNLYLNENITSNESNESNESDKSEEEESTTLDDSKEGSEEMDFLSPAIGRTWKRFSFVQLRRFASKLRLTTGSNPTVEHLKKIIGRAIAKKGGLEKLQQEIRSKDRVRVKTLKTDEEYHVLKQGQAWKKMEHTELRRFAKHLLVPATRNPTALELIKNIGKALAKEKKKGKKQ